MPVTAKSKTSQAELIVPDDTQDQLANLLEREGRIERAQRNAYLEIGLELKAIRDAKLYATPRQSAVAGRYTFTTFEEYVEERWDMSYRRCHEMMESAEAAENLRNSAGFLPSRESHVRELLKIEDDNERAAVWQNVVDRGEPVTAKLVAEEVERHQARKAKEWLTIEEWESCEDRDALFNNSEKKFNPQDNASIEWAQWSWNPITGCKHDCPYCYARDIAHRFYPQKFEPSIYPSRFSAPMNTRVPEKAEQDIAYRNVFTGSMADIFGRWVPSEWIELVLQEVSEHQEWNFLFLTKFPQRVAEFGELPKNAWMGTTVDCQDRVANAEKAFAKMGGGIKWLSVEPMLTPLKFKKLDMFDWVVIGGASSASKTPEWMPPFDWVVDLHQAARAAGCAIYQKANLGVHESVRLKEFPWQKPAAPKLPDALKYLNIK